MMIGNLLYYYQMTHFDDSLKLELNDLETKKLIWNRRILSTASVPRAVVDGNSVLILCSNNYLGLTTHPRLKKAAIDAINLYGVGSGSVRTIAGNMDIHEKLEHKISTYKRCESALIFPTGFAANSGSIPQLTNENDVIISDELNHGSIIDGVKLSKAEKRVFKHGDSDDLSKIMDELSSKSFNRKLIVTDGVFSMDGDIAPLPDFVKIAKKHDAILYVDDAHGEGVLGENGRGISSHFNLEGQVDIEVGTFSKAFGNVGGYISGSSILTDYMYNKSRTHLLSASLPPSTAASCYEALCVIEDEPHILERLWSNVSYFKKGLSDNGFDIGNSVTPITPIMLGDSSLAQKFSDELLKLGILALPIVYPMVAKNKSRIRTMITSSHSIDDLDLALSKIEQVGHNLKII